MKKQEFGRKYQLIPIAQRGILIDVAAERQSIKSPPKPHHIKVCEDALNRLRDGFEGEE